MKDYITQRLEAIQKEIDLILGLTFTDVIATLYETRMLALEEEKQILERLLHPIIDRVSNAGYLSLAKGDSMDLVIDNIVNEVNRN